MKALVFNLRVISVENQLILEEGSERGFLFTYWRLIRHPRILGGGGGRAHHQSGKESKKAQAW